MNTPRSGFTALEAAITTAIIGLVLSTLMTFAESSSEAHRAQLVSVGLHDRGKGALERIEVQLQSARLASITPQVESPLFTTVIDFQREVGTGAVAVWGPTERIGLELDDGEVDDGLDNDNDGMTDERRVVWTRALGTAEEQRSVLARDVPEWGEDGILDGLDDNGNGVIDEPGFFFTFENGALVVSLSLQSDVGQPTHSAGTFEGKIHVRN